MPNGVNLGLKALNPSTLLDQGRSNRVCRSREKKGGHCDGLFTYMLQFNPPCLFKAVNCNYSSAASPVSNVNCSSPVFTGYCD